MTALEIDSTDRRVAPRLRIAGTVTALIGRGDGVLIDLSDRGAKVRHFTMVRRGALVRLSFEWEGERFSANAEVLASRVVSLGNGAGSGTTYESRLCFRDVPPPSESVLARALESLADRDVRRWVSNLRGWGDEPVREPLPFASGSFLRCRYLGTRWEKKCTHDLTQPEDGFLLPAGVDHHEVETLCSTYAHMDDEGRRVVRLMAAAAVDQACGALTRSA